MDTGSDLTQSAVRAPRYDVPMKGSGKSLLSELPKPEATGVGASVARIAMLEELAVAAALEHRGTGAACGRCNSCQLRRRGFAEAGLVDPLRYA